MGLITDYEIINSKAYYYIDFQLEDQFFILASGIENPKTALKIFKDLKQKGIFPKISRKIHYNSNKHGYLTKDPCMENLTIEKLEEIVRTNKATPSFRKSIVSSNYRC